MVAKAPTALTVGEIGRRLNTPVHKIEYILRSRNVKPMLLAGNARVFSEADLQFIGSELRRIDEERGVEQ